MTNDLKECLLQIKKVEKTLKGYKDSPILQRYYNQLELTLEQLEEVKLSFEDFVELVEKAN